MIQVLEVHEEIQSALSEPMADSVDADLESELAELLGANVDNLSSDLSRFDVSFSGKSSFIVYFETPASFYCLRYFKTNMNGGKCSFVTTVEYQ